MRSCCLSQKVTIPIRLVNKLSERGTRKHKSFYQRNNPNTKRNSRQSKDFSVNDAAKEVLQILPTEGQNETQNNKTDKRDDVSVNNQTDQLNRM